MGRELNQFTFWFILVDSRLKIDKTNHNNIFPKTESVSGEIKGIVVNFTKPVTKVLKINLNMFRKPLCVYKITMFKNNEKLQEMIGETYIMTREYNT